MKSDKKPILTIGMIVKNEIRCIERCLKSLQPLREAVPSELIVADTGSDDGTREVVERYADEVFDFEWVNDFSAARNSVVDRANGEWFFTVDADEWLDEDCSDLVGLFTDPVKRKKFNVGSVTQRNYDTDNLADGSYGDLIAVRIFKLLPGVRYEGAIHELPCHPPHETAECYAMRDAILHHDGYVYGIAMGKGKQGRNMELLREKLNKNPKDLFTLQQCIESSTTPAEQLKYVRKALEGIEEKWEIWELCGPGIFAHAVRVAQGHSLPEFWDWAKRAEELFPDSILFRSDVNHAAFLVAQSEEKHAEAIRRGEAYLQAAADYRAKRFDQIELFRAVPYSLSEHKEREARVQMAHLYYLEKDYPAALEMARTLESSKLDDQNLLSLFFTFLNLYTHSELDLTDAFEAFWTQLSAPVPDQKRANRRIGLVTRNAMRAFSQKFQENETKEGLFRHAYTLFLPLKTRCGLGIAAALVETKSVQEMDRLLEQVSEWENFPPHALAYALENGAAFPVPGKPLPLDLLDAVATRLAQIEDDFLQELCVHIAVPDDLGDLNWARALLLAAVQSCEWKNPSRDLLLARRFAELERAYLSRCYTPEMLEGEGLLLLPPLHRFGACLVRAFDALDRGDRVEYVRLIREGLILCESIKPMAEFLHDQAEAMNAEPPAELLVLAEQVKKLLASYPADSPVIETIKASPEYKQVAYLIEETPAVNPKYPLS